MRDVRALISVGLPALSMIACFAVDIANPQLYREYVRKHEVGALEHGTVILLVPAIAIGVGMLRRAERLPSPWLKVWVLLLTAGAFYFAGEECSWGQNYVGWGTPEYWSRFNDQHETNLHNTSNLFDHVPRALLTLGAGSCIVLVVLRARSRLGEFERHPLAWLLPTAAVVPSAALAILVGVPQKLYGHYEKTAEAQNWFSEMFLAGRHSELKEYFLAMFILVYVWSLAARLKNSAATPRQGLQTDDSNRVRSAA